MLEYKWSIFNVIIFIRINRVPIIVSHFADCEVNYVIQFYPFDA